MSMLAPRRLLFVLAIGAGILAAGLYYASSQRAEVIVMARDIDEPRVIVAEDIEVRTFAAELAPDGAARRIEDVVGLVPRAPMLRGQIVLTRSVTLELADFRSGQKLASGFRAVAIPVTAVNAVGGAVIPGARVDVLAIPVAGRAPVGRGPELLITGASVLDVRGESGAPYTQREQKPGAVTLDRIASVIIAIPFIDEARLADRIATSTFVIALVGAR